MKNHARHLSAINQNNAPIEEAILQLEKDHTETNIYHLMNCLQEELRQQGQFFIPVLDTDDLEEPLEDLFAIDKLDLADYLKPAQPRAAIPRKVELFKGGSAYTAFTSQDELDKGEVTKFTSISMKDMFELAFEDPDCVGVVLNPWDVSVLLDKKLLKLLLQQKHSKKIAGRIFITQDDITTMEVDAVVNAANTSLIAGGGVCGAIFDAAGPQLHQACRKLGGCEVGQAKMTSGFDLPASYIIHTPGPVYSGSREDEIDLANCYYNALEVARQNGLHSIAFPAISTGIYGYPLEEAVPVAVLSVSRWLSDHPHYPIDIYLVCFDEKTLEAYHRYTS